MTWPEFLHAVRRAGEKAEAEQAPPPWIPEALAQLERFARPRLRVVRVRD